LCQQQELAMHKLKISRMDFELAFELSSYETTAYLDTETGKVIFVENYVVNQLEELLTNEEDLDDIQATVQAQASLTEMERVQLMDAARVEKDMTNRYRMLPQQDSRDGYREMQEYIESLVVEQLQELLATAIQGSGAFRRFKDVLYRYPEAPDNWLKFRNERQQQRRLDWLNSEGIEPDFE
jgi:hypothetical protein